MRIPCHRFEFSAQHATSAVSGVDVHRYPERGTIKLHWDMEVRTGEIVPEVCTHGMPKAQKR